MAHLHYNTKVIEGYRIASGLTSNSPYSDGSIKLQTPVFQALGLDISNYYPGTINININPYIYTSCSPWKTFLNVDWIDLNPPEDFSFFQVILIYESNHYDGLIYLPHPETKARHHQSLNILEILAPYIENISYGDELEIIIDSNEIVFIREQ
jgi:hypothetical protein